LKNAPLAMIVAMTPRRAIGKAGGIPWHLPEDLKHFKAKTTGHAIIMGRKTFESIGRPLPNRRSIVITRSDAPLPEGVERASTLEGAIALARETDTAPFVIGGGEIYRAAMPHATELYVTLAEGVDDAGSDTFFPDIDPTEFEEVERTAGSTAGLTFVRYRRRSDTLGA